MESVSVSTNKDRNLAHGIIALTLLFNIVMLFLVIMSGNINAFYVLTS